ncbi:MAG: hypothetical protein ICV51_04450 [Flavisolibacter sp.]|nr:hypothetical protein [Flavisolibacter sp.]MBD0349907.1 hypothetical protein [Flavisolibacter sp.]MBD0374862.1 hypothetical protein [Flavisolibacter sp.]
MNNDFLVKGDSKLSRMFYNIKRKPFYFFIIIVIVLITAIKFSLIGNGFYAFPDEFRYASSGMALQYLSELNIKNAIKAIFSTQGRPGDAIIKTIPNAVQYVTAKISKNDYYETANTYPLFIFNYIIYCLILIVHYRFSKLILKDSYLAIISVLLFSSLTNSYLYLRHALPYDASLLVFYLLIYIIVNYTTANSLKFYKSFLIGFFLFFGYLVYPGFFPLYCIALGLFFLNNFSINIFSIRVYHSIYLVTGSIFCLIIFELMSRLGGGVSYISQALYLSSTIKQGSFEESFSFIVKYLFEVEGLTGIFLIISIVLFIIILIQIINKTFKQHVLVLLLGLLVIGSFLAYACAGYFFHKMVFYGRLLHQYFPFISIFSLFTLRHLIQKEASIQLLLSLLSLVFTINFMYKFNYYKTFSYPRDIAWELIKSYDIRELEEICEHSNSWSVFPKQKGKLRSNIILVNCCYFYPVTNINNYKLFTPKYNYKLIVSKRHFNNFKAYQYEGYNIIERKNLDKMNLKIKAYTLEINDVYKDELSISMVKNYPLLAAVLRYTRRRSKIQHLYI